MAGCVVLAGPNMLLFCSGGLFKLNKELVLAPFPVVSFGGGPAGVVDDERLNSVVGLLVGVNVSAWPEETAVAPGFPRRLPVPEAPPNILVVCV